MKISRRWQIIYLLCSGITVNYTFRVVMSVAIEGIRNDYGWTDFQQGIALSAFYWGYASGMVPSSELAKIVGPKNFFGLSILIPAILTISLPYCCAISFQLFLLARVLIGLFASACFPSAYHLFPYWIPTQEKASMIPIVNCGIFLGEILGFSISNGLMEITLPSFNEYISSNWSLCFYLFGLMGLIWYPIWMTLAAESPSLDPFITSFEKDYLIGEYEKSISSNQLHTKELIETSSLCPTCYHHYTTTPTEKEKEEEEDHSIVYIPPVMNRHSHTHGHTSSLYTPLLSSSSSSSLTQVSSFICHDQSHHHHHLKQSHHHHHHHHLDYGSMSTCTACYHSRMDPISEYYIVNEVENEEEQEENTSYMTNTITPTTTATATTTPINATAIVQSPVTTQDIDDMSVHIHYLNNGNCHSFNDNTDDINTNMYPGIKEFKVTDKYNENRLLSPSVSLYKNDSLSSTLPGPSKVDAKENSPHHNNTNTSNISNTTTLLTHDIRNNTTTTTTDMSTRTHRYFPPYVTPLITNSSKRMYTNATTNTTTTTTTTTTMNTNYPTTASCHTNSNSNNNSNDGQYYCEYHHIPSYIHNNSLNHVPSANTNTTARFYNIDTNETKEIQKEVELVDYEELVPWKAFFTTPATLTLLLCCWTSGWTGFLLLSELPTYLHDQLHLNSQSLILFTSLPYIILLLSTSLFMLVFRMLQEEYNWTTHTIRQCSQLMAFGGSSIMFMMCSFLSDIRLRLLCLMMSQVFLAAQNSGLSCAFLDIAPRYSGYFNSVGNFISALGGLSGPLCVSYLIHTYDTIWGWHYVFILTLMMSIISCVSWILFQSSDMNHILNTPIYKEIKKI